MGWLDKGGLIGGVGRTERLESAGWGCVILLFVFYLSVYRFMILYS